MVSREQWAKIFAIIGGLAVAVGALDPLEGSLLILPGCAMLAAAAYIGKADKSILRYRTWVFILAAFGIGWMFGLSSVGGFGGPNGLSWWWGLLILPYFVALPMAICGPGLPRWLYWAGILPGFWYLAISIILLRKPAMPHMQYPIVSTVAALGLVIVGGCALRLLKDPAKQ